MPRRDKYKIPDRMGGPDSGIDLKQLNEALGQIATEGRDSRAEALELLRETMTSAMKEAEGLFEHGRLGGLEMARLIAAIHDEIIMALYDFTVTHVIRAENPTKAERMSLCAVGGYGRGEMAPKSDVDLLFLTPTKKGSAHTESVTEYMLYMLWDLGLKVGHATRTVEQCIKLAKEDQTILTALLDLRFLAGDEALAQTLYKKFRKDITRGRGRGYIAGKLEERDARHTRDGNSRYVIEPNIKEGKGGLRDLHVLYWIARYLDKEGKITDPQRASDYVDMGLFDEQAATRFVRAADFLWRARIWLHHLTGRATETLSFDKQVLLARKMGHAGGAVEVAVERFMREYFINAKEVGALTRIACAKLEAEKSILLPKGLDTLLPGSRRNLKNPAFVLDHGRLMFADPMQIRDDPSIILQLFETAGRRNLDIHPDAFSAIDYRRNVIDAEFRRNPANSQIFQKLLLSAKAPYATLKIMNEADVLGRYLTEFGGIVGRTQFNMHHAFTVDEHTLRLVFYLDDLRQDRMREANPIISDIVQGFDDQQMLIMYLACLLHDTGKGQGDQCIEGAQLARRACRRLGMSSDVTNTVAWLVRHHLDMSETAQRRDISDPDTIAAFGELVGSIERLKLLAVLTVIDIHAVGPGVWNDWKAVLLRGLYQNTEGFLEGRTDLVPAAKARSIEEQIRDRLSPDMLKKIDPIISDLPDNYWLNFDMADLMRHMRFYDGLVVTGDDTAVQTRHNKTRNVTELWVATKDRKGLFADLTLAISSCGASICGARLHTGEQGQVMDVFYLHGIDGLAFGVASNHVLETLRRRAREAVMGQTDDLTIPKPLKSKRAGAIPVKTAVRFPSDVDSSGIIEVEGRDRPGLLGALAGVIRDEGLDIRSAHIEVVGTTAIDAFYLRDLPGGTFTESQKKSLKAALMNALEPASTKQTAA